MLEKNLTNFRFSFEESSFTKASQLSGKQILKPLKKLRLRERFRRSIPIKRNNDGKTIANAYITTDQLSIVLDKEIELDDATLHLSSHFHR